MSKLNGFFVCERNTFFTLPINKEKSLFNPKEKKNVSKSFSIFFAIFQFLRKATLHFSSQVKEKKKEVQSKTETLSKCEQIKKTFLNCKKSIFFLLGILANIVNVKITITSENKIW
jgi:hypothetical protein